MAHRPHTPAIVAAYALLCLVWGTTWSAIRLGLDGIPPFAGVALRFAIASAALFALGWLRGVRFGRQRREVALWLVNGLFSFCASYGIVYWSEQWIPSGLAAVLFASFTLFVAALAHFFLREERLVPASAAGVLLGFAGVATIFSEDLTRLGGPGTGLAALVMLGSPLAAAIGNVAVKRWGGGIHPLSLTAPPMALTAVVMGTVSLLSERSLPWAPKAHTIAALLYLALAGSALTFSLYFWLLEHLPATRMSLIAYLTPVTAILIGVGLFDEPLTARTLAGSGLVVLGVALATRR